MKFFLPGRDPLAGFAVEFSHYYRSLLVGFYVFPSLLFLVEQPLDKFDRFARRA